MTWNGLMQIFITLLGEIIQVCGAIIAALFMRWLLGLSSPEQDMKWLRRQKWYRELQRLKFYRGLEYLHQVNFWRIVNK